MILETATALVCLAQAIYFEGRSESTVGQIAIGQVIMNRVDDHRFPDTVCEVVTDGRRYSQNNSMVRDKCAFSFYCDGKTETIRDKRAYDWSKTISMGILNNSLHIDLTDGATHYHADYIKMPYWAKDLTKTVCINTHCFYRWEIE